MVSTDLHLQITRLEEPSQSASFATWPSVERKSSAVAISKEFLTCHREQRAEVNVGKCPSDAESSA